MSRCNNDILSIRNFFCHFGTISGVCSRIGFKRDNSLLGLGDSMLRSIVVNLRKVSRILRKYFDLLPIIFSDRTKFKIVLSNSYGGNAVRDYLHRRTYGLRVSSAARILVLPEDCRDMLRGKKHQAWRTNVKRAEEFGMRVRRVTIDEFSTLAQNASTSDNPPAHLSRLISEPTMPHMETWVGEADDGEVIAFARYVVDGQCAVMKYFVATPNRDLSIIRWKMASDTFSDFIKRGVKFVVSGSAINLSDGIDYYQDRLGFVKSRLEVIIDN